MKIVDRETFMKMPRGTVFCKFPRFNPTTRAYSDKAIFGIEDPKILCNTSGVDFTYIAPGWMNPTDGDTFAVLMDMESHLGDEHSFEHVSSRDGLYEGNEVGFAIYSRNEVEQMIEMLRQALHDGYGLRCGYGIDYDNKDIEPLNSNDL